MDNQIKMTEMSQTLYQQMKDSEKLARISHRKSTATSSQAVFIKDALSTVLDILLSMSPEFVYRIFHNYNMIRRFATTSCEKCGVDNVIRENLSHLGFGGKA